MANYLERVASSAGRRAAIARPPNSGPPVLPPGRDLSLAVEDPFASEQDQFLEPFETPAPARSAEIASTPKLEVTEESRTTPTQDPKSASSVVPKTRPPHERLSSEAPFTVSVPRTLRPLSTENVQPIAPTEPLRERSRVQASTTREEPAPIVPSTDSDVKEVKESVITEVRSAVADPTDEHQAPIPRLVHTEVTAPIPRVNPVDGPPRVVVAEPSPPPVSPVHVSPVISSATKQEQSRITIGSLEVLVNNHPRVTPSRPTPTPSRTERLSLEKRYLDRFRLRH
jgi:hypothetical protein